MGKSVRFLFFWGTVYGCIEGANEALYYRFESRLARNVLVNLNIRKRRSNSQFSDLSKPSGFRHQLDHISVLPQPAEPVRNEPVLSVITNRYQYETNFFVRYLQRLFARSYSVFI